MQARGRRAVGKHRTTGAGVSTAAGGLAVAASPGRIATPAERKPLFDPHLFSESSPAQLGPIRNAARFLANRFHEGREIVCTISVAEQGAVSACIINECRRPRSLRSGPIHSEQTPLYERTRRKRP